jgi:acyl-CoA synthetase (AMP-forming)/AMP-acid ligase II
MKDLHPIAICPLPMFHSYGLHAYILRATLFPATYVILEKWNTAQYLKAIAKCVCFIHTYLSCLDVP